MIMSDEVPAMGAKASGFFTVAYLLGKLFQCKDNIVISDKKDHSV